MIDTHVQLHMASSLAKLGLVPIWPTVRSDVEVVVNKRLIACVEMLLVLTRTKFRCALSCDTLARPIETEIARVNRCLVVL